MGSILRGLVTLGLGGSVGSAVTSSIGIDNPIIMDDIIDNSAIGQAANDSLGNYKSTSAKEISARNAEMSYNHTEAQLTREWLERMSNTSYQRAAADLRAAGLNPALLYSAGGASTPGAGAASYSGYASAYVGANASYRNARLGSTTSIVNSAINALSRIGIASILSTSRG